MHAHGLRNLVVAIQFTSDVPLPRHNYIGNIFGWIVGGRAISMYEGDMRSCEALNLYIARAENRP